MGNRFSLVKAPRGPLQRLIAGFGGILRRVVVPLALLDALNLVGCKYPVILYHLGGLCHGCAQGLQQIGIPAGNIKIPRQVSRSSKTSVSVKPSSYTRLSASISLVFFASVRFSST